MNSYAERILSKCGQWGTTSSSSSTSTATATPTTKSNTTTNTNTSRRVSLDNDRDSDIDSTPSSYSTPYSKSKPISPRTNDFNTGPSSSISYSSATKNSVAISPLRPQTLEMSQSPGLSPNTATATASTANVRSGYVHTPSPSPSPFRHEAPSKASLSSSTALSRGTANELPVLNILLIDEVQYHTVHTTLYYIAAAPCELTNIVPFLLVMSICSDVILILQIDALGGRSDDSSSDIQLALKAILCAWMDKQSDVHDPDNGHKPSSSLLLLKPKVVIFGTSNRAEDVDPVLRRGGRLEMEIEVSGSGVGDRSRLIKSLLDKSLPPALQSLGIIRGPHHPHPDDNNNDGDGDGYDYNPSLDLTDFVDDMAEITGGYVAADLIALVSEAMKLLIAMDMSNNNNNFIQGGDSTNKSHVLELELLKMCFQKARRVVLPSCLRGATITLPSLRMSDVIGHEEAKKSLLSILSLSAPSAASRRRQKLFGLTSSSVGGALLWGPPGNSKTRLVLAVASERGLPVVSLGSADVFSPYVGDAEASIRRAFRLARQSSPCVLLLDELDALVGNRDNETSVSAESRVLATLLSEMDGIGGSSHGVIVLGATNRLDSIDAALLRKGRFHQLLHVPCPNENDRIALLEYFCRRSGLSDGNIQNDLKTSLRAGMSGADVENVCREAAMSCLRDIVNKTNVMSSSFELLSFGIGCQHYGNSVDDKYPKPTYQRSQSTVVQRYYSILLVARLRIKYKNTMSSCHKCL
eukprot:gene4596-9132_t